MIDVWILLYIIDGLLFIIAAVTVLYLGIFTAAAFFHKPHHIKKAKKENRIIVIIPSYMADDTILHTVHSIMGQSYPQRMFDVVVVGDHLAEMTSFKLAQLPITLLTPDFDNSTKARSLQYAMKNLPEFKIYDTVLILNADNIVDTDFLEKLNSAYENSGTKAVQVHRMSSNRDSVASRMAATFDEINNYIFRLGHIAVGLSASIKSSGLMLDFKWFKDHVNKLKTSVEDKEIEVMLLREGIFIDYFDDIKMYEEKAHTVKELHEKQGKYMSAQFNSFFANLKYLPRAIVNKQIDLIDKIVQHTICPRTVTVTIIAVMCILMPMIYMSLAVKWWALAVIIIFIFAVATPDYLVDKYFDKTFTYAPIIMIYSIINIIRANRSLSDFIKHNSTSEEPLPPTVKRKKKWYRL